MAYFYTTAEIWAISSSIKITLESYLS